jgi:hypothetical protein
MTVQEAMRLIDERVAAGASITITNSPPARIAGHDVRETWNVVLRPVWVDGIPAEPSCTAYSQEAAVIGIGAWLARLESA